MWSPTHELASIHAAPRPPPDPMVSPHSKTSPMPHCQFFEGCRDGEGDTHVMTPPRSWPQMNPAFCFHLGEVRSWGLISSLFLFHSLWKEHLPLSYSIQVHNFWPGHESIPRCHPCDGFFPHLQHPGAVKQPHPGAHLAPKYITLCGGDKISSSGLSLT